MMPAGAQPCQGVGESRPYYAAAMQTAPYGTWTSPVTTDLLTAGSTRLGGGTTDGDDLWWLESSPAQRGRTSLWRQSPGGCPVEVTPDHDVRSTIHEYGGGAFAVRDQVAVFTDLTSGVVHVVEPGQEPRPVTLPSAQRYGGFAFLPGGRQVVCVREDHAPGDIDCVNELVRLDLDAEPGPGSVVATGADFYSQPAVSPDGRIAWVEWDHPSMPWDSTRLMVLDDAGPRQVGGGEGESVCYPAWTPDGRLLSCSDRSGFWNLQRWDGSRQVAVTDLEHDVCGPAWVIGGAPYTVIDSERVGLTWWVSGRPRVGVVSPSGTELWPLEVASLQVGGSGSRCLALAGYDDRPSELVLLDWDQQRLTTVRRSSELELDPALVSVAQEITWDGPDGPVHAWYYPPRNPDFEAPAGELAPVIVLCHGGPTAFARADLDLTYLFWTSRGIALLDVNYGGSTGYGREYRNRLRGQWGLSDVRDCVDGARVLAERGLADPARTAVMGGSAGGYTTLQALVSTDVFTAGISLYGIGDLAAMATDTHKFESRYLDGLVAPYPEQEQVYRDRSPIHHLDRLSSPMLLQQGTEDRVVPPQQAETMAAAVRAKGLPVALVWHQGEAHGFRRADSITRCYQASLSFLGQVYGFQPADDLPTLAVENLG